MRNLPDLYGAGLSLSVLVRKMLDVRVEPLGSAHQVKTNTP
jgi:hypothetical protein